MMKSQVFPGGQSAHLSTVMGGLASKAMEDPTGIGPTDGSDTLFQATDVFKFIDPELGAWGLNVARKPTLATRIRFQPIIPNTPLAGYSHRIGRRPATIWLFESQIVSFCRVNRQWLLMKGCGIFFFIFGGKSVAFVDPVDGDHLNAYHDHVKCPAFWSTRENLAIATRQKEGVWH